MTTSTDRSDWRVVDAGWGHAAVDFATLSEPSNCREYVALHHRLGVDAGDRLLDMACGAGLAIELATLRGARCAGIDASPRLIGVARDRNPDADLRAGDMAALPWDDGTFDQPGHVCPGAHVDRPGVRGDPARRRGRVPRRGGRHRAEPRPGRPSAARPPPRRRVPRQEGGPAVIGYL